MYQWDKLYITFLGKVYILSNHTNYSAGRVGLCPATTPMKGKVIQMETIDDEVLFNPDFEVVGKKILWAINNGYDVLIEKTEEFELALRPIKRNKGF